jgi:cell division protein FtsX
LLTSFPGVEEADYGKEKLDRLIGIQAMAELMAMAVGILLILVLLSIISQCFGLLFLTRLPSPTVPKAHQPLRLNHLLAQGSSAGLLGGVFATILLFGVHSLLILRASAIDNDIYGAGQILFISWPFILGLLISGAILGCLGTLIAWRSTGRYQKCKI